MRHKRQDFMTNEMSNSFTRHNLGIEAGVLYGGIDKPN